MLLFIEELDERIKQAILIAKEWEKDNASVGDARKASVSMLQLARELSDSTSIYIARSVGHAVATAHMADHSIGAALYALKAVKSAGENVNAERNWQNDQLPQEIKEFVLIARKNNVMDLKL